MRSCCVDVCPSGPILLQMKKMELKEKWSTLSDNEKEPFEKKKRDHLARQGVMKECITDALQKEKGGNCVRSFASLAKVTSSYECMLSEY